jgi:RNA polymerase sigma factor for flagellar operon FliA
MGLSIQDAELMNRYISSRDPALREEIILRFVPLVHYVLGRIGMSQQIGPDYEDLVSQGLLGLIESIDRYDPAFGAQFSTYATLRIRGKILDYLRSLDWLSRTARRRARSVQNAMNHFWETNQRAPTDEELALKVEMDVDQVQQALTDSSRIMLSLDSMIEMDGDTDNSLYDILADDHQENPSDLMDEQDLKTRLVQALKELPEREQLMLSLYYFENLTLKEIGEVLGISESRVCQLHARAMLILKSQLAPPDSPAEQETSNAKNAQSNGKKSGQPSKSSLSTPNVTNSTSPKRIAYD